ncbi:MAG TPA: hypothetical protein VH136_12070 [Trebonia sp.]|nr:hypothetical protein [Trebonia sp.]
MTRGRRYQRTTGEPITDPDTSRHVEIKDDDDRTAAVADVTTARGPDGTVRTSMYAKNEHVRPGDRAALVDEVMDLPEVKASNRVEATVPLGDAESVERLRERTDDATLRAAGGTTLLDANVPPDDGYPPADGQPPADADSRGRDHQED